MKRVMVLALFTLLFTILDNSVMPFIAIKGYFPSLLFIFVIFISINSDSWQAMRLGILSGILQDIFFYNGLGINILTNMLCCVVAAEIGKGIFKDKMLIPISTLFLLCLAKGAVVFVILYVLNQYSNVYGILFNSIYSLIISLFLYKFLYNFTEKEYMKKNWKF
jgi:rod shape-determining protein MreD